MTELPIVEVLPELRQALASHNRVVLQAPPGSGKTTRVPLALLEEDWLGGKSILMLEPRRIAASSAAHYMASRLGEEAGGLIGYRIRYEQAVSRRTRVEVITEGILSRRLQGDPELEGVGLVIFDEFHERHLDADLALALCLEAQQALRPDLRLLVMSATLDAAPLCDLLEGAPLVQAQGRCYPVEVNYLERRSERPLAEKAARCIEKVLPRTDGDLLVFLPGMRDIQRCQSLLSSLAREQDLGVHPLHGSLSLPEQRRALLPSDKRKIVLSTNVAETSLTIEGVSVVVDAGMARVPRFDVACGLTRLLTSRISRASAEQRTGRAGRLGPGHCFRLWTEAEQGELLPFSAPEIRSADLAGLALQLAQWGVADASSLRWLDAPAPGALEAARALLKSLGALDKRGRITELGLQMAQIPASPRLGRLMLESRKMGCAGLGADLAGLLGESERLISVRPSQGPADPLEALRALERWRTSGQGEGFFAADRAARHLRKALGHGRQDRCSLSRDEAVARLCALAYPDRIAQLRQAEGSGYRLITGRGALLSGPTTGSAPGYLVATGLAEHSREQDRILSCLCLSEELIRELYAHEVESVRCLVWDEELGRVLATGEERLGALVLKSRRLQPEAHELEAAMIQGLRACGLEALPWDDPSQQYCARVRFAALYMPELDWPDLDQKHLLETLEDWIPPWITGMKNKQDLRRLPLLQALRSMLSYEQQRCLEAEVPERLKVPSGSSVRLDYAVEGAPVLAVKLQELFGLAETPRLARGRACVLLHLLSPARRPLQVTQDLRNFWNAIYPQVKKELKGRYPRHPWPDDPWSAPATKHTRKRLSR